MFKVIDSPEGGAAMSAPSCMKGDLDLKALLLPRDRQPEVSVSTCKNDGL